jgi:hypothetical protein
MTHEEMEQLGFDDGMNGRQSLDHTLYAASELYLLGCYVKGFAAARARLAGVSSEADFIKHLEGRAA